MHYYKKNLGDYAKKAGRLSILQHGVYNLLLDACYDRESFPTRDEAIDWVWASTSEEIEAVEFVLRRFFDLQNDGKYVQHRISEELDLYRRKAETNKRIATERETKRKESKTNRERVVNEAPPNHKPITNNHKPITIKELVLPFESKDFKDAWEILIVQPNWKKKSRHALELSLKKIEKVRELVAIKMIENTIAGGWKGLFELNDKDIAEINQEEARRKIKERDERTDNKW